MSNALKSLNDTAAWDLLFNKYDILNYIDVSGRMSSGMFDFTITNSKINRRIMYK